MPSKRKIKLFLVERNDLDGSSQNPTLWTKPPITYVWPLFPRHEIGDIYDKIAERIVGKKLKDGEIWELEISARKIGELDRTRFPEEEGKKVFRSMNEALTAYRNHTIDIENPWPFPKYWIGDRVRFEVLNGGEMGGGCDIRKGTIVSVFSGDSGLDYKVKADDEYHVVPYYNFSGNWK